MKPRFGLGSVGAKRLKSVNDIQYINDLKLEIEHDQLLNSSIGNKGEIEFILEDFIDGQEFSAEIVSVEGSLTILAIHEKYEVHDGIYTTTEPFCISPPIKHIVIENIQFWITQIFDELDIKTGCYHLEFKIDKDNNYEIIEINPRVGGAYIVESTNFISDEDILSLWIKSLSNLYIGKNYKNIELLSNKSINNLTRCTAFRVYFSESKGLLKSIKQNYCSIMPSNFKILSTLGKKLTCDKSEQYLGQAIWTSTVSTSDLHSYFENIKNISKYFLEFEVNPFNTKQEFFLIFDYNLKRVNEVIYIAEKCRESHGLNTLLITTCGKEIKHPLVTNLTIQDIKRHDCLEILINEIQNKGYKCRAGVIFSDDGIITGSAILEYFGLKGDSSTLAVRSFDKLAYREAENKSSSTKNVSIPKFVSNVKELLNDPFNNPWIVKPRCEGNNRGVIKINKVEDLDEALLINDIYLKDGIFAEECINIREEFSVDGIGGLEFITKKLSLRGKYPLEIGQVVPPKISNEIQVGIKAASQFANEITGQYIGAFHNEIMICNDTNKIYVVEPNRRPGGMKIWKLISKSFNIDLYSCWIKSSFEGRIESFEQPLTPLKATALLMLPGPSGIQAIDFLSVIDIESYVAKVWEILEIENLPNLIDIEILCDDEFICPKEIRDGHDFLLNIMVESDLNYPLEENLLKFYKCWENNIYNLFKQEGLGK